MEPASPILGAIAQQIGKERMDKFIGGHAEVQAMSLFLVMSTMTVPGQGYSQDALECMRSDIDDVEAAAQRWCESSRELVHAWEQQRKEQERGNG